MGTTKKSPDNGNYIGSKKTQKSSVRPVSEQERNNRIFDMENDKIFSKKRNTGSAQSSRSGSTHRPEGKTEPRRVKDTHGPARTESADTNSKAAGDPSDSSDPFDPFGKGSPYGDAYYNIHSPFDRPERSKRPEKGSSSVQEPSRSKRPQNASGRSSSSGASHSSKPRPSQSKSSSSVRDSSGRAPSGRAPSNTSRSKSPQSSSKKSPPPVKTGSGHTSSSVSRAPRPQGTSTGSSSSVRDTQNISRSKRPQDAPHRSASSHARPEIPRTQSRAALPEEEPLFKTPKFIKNLFSGSGPVFPSKEKAKKEKKKRDPKKVFYTVLASVAVLLIAICIAGICVYNSVVESTFRDLIIEDVDTSWKDDPHDDVKDISSKSNTSGVTNILFLGIDDNGGSGCRSDTVMIASITDTGLKLTSILRDNYVYVPGHGRTKLNHAYAYGGAALTMQTIESNYRLHIDEYVSVSMEDLGEIVKAAGGVTIEITAAEAKEINNFLGCNIGSGVQRLTPDQAVYYSRIRRIDSDFGRTERQRKLMFAVLDECLNMSYPQMFSFVKSVCPYLTTNMQPKRIASLAIKAFPHAKEPIGELHLPMEGTYSFKMVSGMSVISSNMRENVMLLREFIYGKK